jgi:2-keto-3-deoxy-L-rhamnonate aldolase RhmA
MKKNKIRELLNAGRPTIGTRLHNIWPSVVEVIGHTGMFDYVEFLAEYAPYTLPELDNFCRAAELCDLGTMIKIDAASRAFFAQRAIGTGFGSVLFADSRSADDARECVRIVRPDTPSDNGTYGAATRRFAYMGYGGNEEYVQALRDVVVVLMIEKRQAVEHLDEILAVGGVDMVQWGPADYSMSIGKPGQRRDPEVRAAEKKVFETCLRAGIPPRAEINTPDDARYYLDMGVRHFSLANDLAILFNFLKDNGEKLRGLLS